ncbi:MAG: type II toxin-antitoxin system HicB family antitoxin [Deltaproteobacteria bacterium]|nr:type II toxin-antitoxin system HicB family antitoxin [Deltaproteobacteria bacterium]
MHHRAGWQVEFPDLPGCIADGETIEEAVNNASNALRSWLATAKESKDPVPAPSAQNTGPGTCSHRSIQAPIFFSM